MKQEVFDLMRVRGDCTLQAALQRLEITAHGILLLLDEQNRLTRTVTDGDLRRALLFHSTEELTLAALPARQPITASTAASMAQVLSLMDQYQIDQIPIVNALGQAVDVVFRRELTQKVWLSSPHLGDEETAFVEEAFRTNWIAPLGPHVDAFERELAAHVGMRAAAALSSGTAAIHLGLLLLGVKPGDTVFCSSLTFVGSCNPILYCGAKPVFIDSEPNTWNLSPAALERAFEWAKREKRLPRCVIVVNLYGQSADMDALIPICERYGVPILEDAAESLGASYKQRASGSFGVLGVYSFNGNKIITTSGGGMLVSNDESLIARARKLSTQARENAAHYEHTEVGFNYRMSNVLAGIGRGQLKVLPERAKQRRAIFFRYREALRDVESVQWMPEPQGYYSTRWLTCLSLLGDDAPQRRDALLRNLERHSIEARSVWKPMHLQPLFASAPYFEHDVGQDVSRHLFDSGVCLPSGSNMAPEQIERVIDHLRHALAVTGEACALE
jgi:dTDP-4-amino-4,6-dideoxygalactose transaminase